MSELHAYFDHKETYDALLVLITRDCDLALEIDQLFLGKHARYESGGVFRYTFKIHPGPADRTDGQNIVLAPRDKGERSAVLAAPEKYGLVVRHEVSELATPRL